MNLEYVLEWWKPGAVAVGPTGERTRTYDRIPMRCHLRRTGGGLEENADVEIPNRSREYVVRHRSDLSTGWYLQDGDDWYRVTDVSPLAGARRKGYQVVMLSYSRERPIPQAGT